MSRPQRSPITKSIATTLIEATKAGFINTGHFEDHLSYELQVKYIDPKLVLEVFKLLPINILSLGLKNGFEGRQFKDEVYSFISKRRAKFTVELRKINKHKLDEELKLNEADKIKSTITITESEDTEVDTKGDGHQNTDENEHAFYLPSLPKELRKFGQKSTIRQLYFNLDLINLIYTTDKPCLSLILKKWPYPEVGNIKIEQHQREALIHVMASDDFIFGRFSVSKDKNMCARVKETVKSGQKRYELTIKAPGVSCSNRKEINLNISSQLFNKIFSLDVTHPIIEKTRYKLSVDDDNGFMWEVDEFTSPFPFVKAECEVHTPNSPPPSTPGHWEAVYVTGQRQFDNDFICTSTTPPIPDQLKGVL